MSIEEEIKQQREQLDDISLPRLVGVVDKLADGALPFYNLPADVSAYMVGEEGENILKVDKLKRVITPLFELKHTHGSLMDPSEGVAFKESMLLIHMIQAQAAHQDLENRTMAASLDAFKKQIIDTNAVSVLTSKNVFDKMSPGLLSERTLPGSNIRVGKTTDGTKVYATSNIKADTVCFIGDKGVILPYRTPLTWFDEEKPFEIIGLLTFGDKIHIRKIQE